MKIFAVIAGALLSLSLHAQMINPTQIKGTSVAVLNIDTFPGIDLSQKLAAAAASLGGTAASPIPSAKFVCGASKTYVITTGSVEVPRGDAPPYIQAPVIDCNRSTIQEGRALPATPLIHIGPTNALNDAVGSGSFSNANVIETNTTTIPAIQMQNRLGFHMDHINVVGGVDAIEMNSTGGTDGSGNPLAYHYLEQNWFTNMGISGCGRSGYNMTTSAGGDGGHLYNHFFTKFDLDGACTTMVLNSALSNMQGEEMAFWVNTGTGTSYHVVTNNGINYISSKLFVAGEPTGNGNAILYIADGSSYSHPTVSILFRGFTSYGAMAQATIDSGCAAGENSYLGRNGVVCNGGNLLVYLAENGSENNSAWSILGAPTGSGSVRVTDSTTKSNRIGGTSLGGTYVGPGWNDDQHNTFTGTVTNGSATITGIPVGSATLAYSSDSLTATISSNGVTTAYSGSVLTVNGSANSITMASPVTLNTGSASTVSGVTFTVTKVAAPFDFTVHGLYGSLPQADTSGVNNHSEYSLWVDADHFSHDCRVVDLAGQPGGHCMQRMYTPGVNSNFTPYQDCQFTPGVTDATTCTYKGSHVFTDGISTGTLTTGTTCSVGGFITVIVDGTTRKIAYCN